jgi:hypothetical protein
VDTVEIIITLLFWGGFFFLLGKFMFDLWRP